MVIEHRGPEEVAWILATPMKNPSTRLLNMKVAVQRNNELIHNIQLVVRMRR
jgi:hypothetical protein